MLNYKQKPNQPGITSRIEMNMISDKNAKFIMLSNFMQISRNNDAKFIKCSSQSPQFICIV